MFRDTTAACMAELGPGVSPAVKRPKKEHKNMRNPFFITFLSKPAKFPLFCLSWFAAKNSLFWFLRLAPRIFWFDQVSDICDKIRSFWRIKGLLQRRKGNIYISGKNSDSVSWNSRQNFFHLFIKACFFSDFLSLAPKSQFFPLNSAPFYLGVRCSSSNISGFICNKLWWNHIKEGI